MEPKPLSESSNMNKESYQIRLGSKESKIKIGKVLDEVNFSNSQITNEGKHFCLFEKKPGKPDTKYIGAALTEQTSKYLIFKYNESTRTLEAYPVSDWYSFKKEIHLAQTLTLEEVEEKMKPQVSIINQFKKKGGIETVKKGGKRKRNAGNKNGGGARGGGGKGQGELLDELSSEKEEPIPKEDNHSNENRSDVDSKALSSDIEEGLQQTKKIGVIEKTLADQNNPPKSLEDFDDSSDADGENNDDDSSDDFENADSEINEEEVDKGLAQGLLGLKRKREDEGNEAKKSRSVYSEMEEYLDSMLSRNKQMTYEKIAKEMAKRYTASDIELHLRTVLDKNTKMFTQGSDTYYYKKFD